MSGKPNPEKPITGACPICKKPSAVAARPFCSKRCRDLDLHKWLTGGYAIPTEEVPDEEDLAMLERDTPLN